MAHHGVALDEQIKKCYKSREASLFKKIEYGSLYFNGEKLDTAEFLKGKNVIIQKESLELKELNENVTNKLNITNNDIDFDFDI